MNMRSFITAAVLVSFAIALPQLAKAQPQLPRKAPELTISEPSGQKTLLSSYKGKVVVIAFVNTGCPHCQRECQMLTQLFKETKPSGVQMLGVAFNDNAAALVPAFVKDYGVGFPVGSAMPDTVVNFLGFSIMDRYVVPQVAVIDRKGMIRAQSGPQGDPNLQDAGFLKNLIDTLAKEGATTTTSKAGAKPKVSSNLH
jgi:peroxiredoxin